MKKAIMKVNMSISSSENEFLILITNSEIKRVRAPNIEPRDTNLLIQTVRMKTNKEIATGIGTSAIKTPADVATPLPPLKFKKTVKMWPKIAKSPVAIIIRSEVSGIISLAILTARNPFPISMNKVKIPTLVPNILKAFVAPTLPLPNSRISIPLIIFPMM